MVNKIKKNRFNKLLHISTQLDTQSPKTLQKAVFLYSYLSKLPFYTFNEYKDYPLSLELHQDILKLKELTSKFSQKHLISKYKLTKQQNLEHQYIINNYFQGSTIPINALTQQKLPIYSLTQNQTQNRSKYGVNEVFTIGYEGKSIDDLISILKSNRINTLIDIRNNPLSYKFGYSKDDLKKYLKIFSLNYLHLKDLGVESSIRNKEEISLNDIWKHYKKKLTPQNEDLQMLITTISNQKSCLMCFESNHNDCHRHILSNYLKNTINTVTVHL